MAKNGAVAATYVIAPLVLVEQLNAACHELLQQSLFQQHAYLHLQLSGNAVFEWSRATGWRSDQRQPDDGGRESRQTLDMLREHGGFGRDGLLPNTEVVGRWRP